MNKNTMPFIIAAHIHVVNSFLDIPSIKLFFDLKTISLVVINNSFSDFINCYFPNFITVITECLPLLFSLPPNKLIIASDC